MIAVDAMGGDHAPHAIVHGAVAAARSGVPILLVGKKEVIVSLLPSDWKQLPITLEFCSDHITMAEDPGRAVRSKSHSSLVVAMKAVAQSRASAFFSAGNSGAVMVAAVLIIGRTPNIHRPAVGTFLPARTGSFFCLDVGATVDCKSHYLYQFAVMGHAYLYVTKGIKNPRIGLLSNGHEAYKGPTEIKKAYEKLFHSPLNFIGNIEARDIGEGTVDVVVCDGFVGNVMIKTMQGTARALFGWLKDETRHSWVRRLLLWASRGIFTSIKKRLDYTAIGGALMLGIQRPVVLAHGSSDARAIENGIMLAYKIVQEKQVERFNALVTSLLPAQHSFSGAVKQKVRSLFHWGQS